MKKSSPKTGLKKLATNAGQLFAPPEFAIAKRALPRDFAERTDRLTASILHAGTAAPGPAPEAAPRPRGEDRALERFVADIATGVWRLRRRMTDRATGRPLEHLRREYRHVESLWDVLLQAGVEIKDFDGQPFDPGSEIKVLEYIPKPGLARLRVQETIKPLVFFRNRRAQVAEVIAETPETTPAADSAAPAAPAEPARAAEGPPPAPPASAAS